MKKDVKNGHFVLIGVFGKKDPMEQISGHNPKKEIKVQQLFNNLPQGLLEVNKEIDNL